MKQTAAQAGRPAGGCAPPGGSRAVIITAAPLNCASAVLCTAGSPKRMAAIPQHTPAASPGTPAIAADSSTSSDGGGGGGGGGGRDRVGAGAGAGTVDSRADDANRDASRGEAPAPAPVTRVDSFKGALTRALLGALAVFFRAPVRLYRPVKISALSVLDALAQREGTTLSLRFLRTVWKRESPGFFAHLLGPPLVVNTAIGFTLFEAFSLTERALLRRHAPRRLDAPTRDSAGRPVPQWSPLWIVAASGGVAGAAQCLISAPLDNVRKVLVRAAPSDVRHQMPSRPFSWTAVVRAAVLPFAPTESQHQRIMSKVKDSLSAADARANGDGHKKTAVVKDDKWKRYLAAWRGGAHGAGLVLSLVRDSVGFASFFAVFEISRRVAYHASMAVDMVYYTFNRGPALTPVPAAPGGAAPRRAQGDVQIADAQPSDWRNDQDYGQPSEVDNDVSYKASRSLLGRTVAAVVLIAGGALGAASYELLGRPAELMRTVLFDGERAWHRAMRPHAATGSSAAAHAPASPSAQHSAFRRRRHAVHGGGPAAGARSRAPRRIRRAMRTGAIPGRGVSVAPAPRAPGAYARSWATRRATLAALRHANTAGTSAPRIGWAACVPGSVVHGVHASNSHHRSLAGNRSGNGFGSERASAAASGASEQPQRRRTRKEARWERVRRTQMQLAKAGGMRKPSAIGILREYAVRQWRRAHPRVAAGSVPGTMSLLVQTYFLQPLGLGMDRRAPLRTALQLRTTGVVPAGTQANALRHTWSAHNAVSKSVVGSKGALNPKAGARFSWWLLRKAFTPYGLAFAFFAITQDPAGSA